MSRPTKNTSGWNYGTPEPKTVDALVKGIMQSGFEVAMGGSPFKSAEENEQDQEKAYDEAVSSYAQKIRTYISDNYVRRDGLANASVKRSDDVKSRKGEHSA